MATSSSSSSSGVPTLPVWLYSLAYDGAQIANRVALVEAPTPLPAILVYLGNYYAWNFHRWVYLQTTPVTVQASGRGAALVSPLAQPKFDGG